MHSGTNTPARFIDGPAMRVDIITGQLTTAVFEGYLADWQEEDSHRGRLVRAFRSNLHDRQEIQLRRVAMLIHYAEHAEGFADPIEGLEYH
ncbi:hypothetical protein ACH4S8_22205 [Streptomyces sp. NPDC021080]|uniref:hypothetical protein n=1 Tax=Streptomyces sp. NPDC021080 TaxID=3365110 RepID=UPI003792CB1A